MDQRLSLITLGVSNLKKATHFYEHVFGWKKSSVSNAHITFFNLNGTVLSIYNKVELAKDALVSSSMERGFNGFTLSYNARSPEEVDVLFKIFKQKGVTIVKQPQKVQWGGYSGYVSDLDEHLWEIAYNPFIKIDNNGNLIM